MHFALIPILSIALIAEVYASCPYLARQQGGATTQKYTDVHFAEPSLRANPHERQTKKDPSMLSSRKNPKYLEAAAAVNWRDVVDDLAVLMTDSQDWFPADFGHYGGLMIRLAWHCAGSYRASDGRGGCDGGRIRFEPELSWEDNVNLEKARRLLWPIKEKYGVGLSWGDLISLAGSAAIESMGGPNVGFCAGREDDADGTASAELGPTEIQRNLYPCDIEGNCSRSTGLGSIDVSHAVYVNPGGPFGSPDLAGSAAQIRDVFGRMGLNDTEVVALSGGHAFGKAHGPCHAGPGPSPAQDPQNPWPGLCGTGIGPDTWTSGFEGHWTFTPTEWNNEYFYNLLFYNWTTMPAPGFNRTLHPYDTGLQWIPVNVTFNASDFNASLFMFTSDLALVNDSAYRPIVERFAKDLDFLTFQFGEAWYKLSTRDMGPRTRCLNSDAPAARDFQAPLPPAPTTLPNFADVQRDILVNMRTEKAALPFDDTKSYGPLYVRLAWQCFNTFRQTDYQGGCNGARIRFSPQKDWSANSYMDLALDLLQPIKNAYGEKLTWADLIVLAGTTALNDAALKAGVTLNIPFIGGRSDAAEHEVYQTPSELELRVQGGLDTDRSPRMRDIANIMGLTDREFVALMGGGHGLGRMHSARSGFPNGTWTTTPGLLNNQYFKTLQNQSLTWTRTGNSPVIHYEAKVSATGKVHMLNADRQFYYDPMYQAIVQEYALDANTFYTDFAAAWYKIMTVDMYGIDTTQPVPIVPNESSDEGLDDASVIGIAVAIGFGVPMLFALGYFYYASKNVASKSTHGSNVGVAIQNPVRIGQST